MPVTPLFLDLRRHPLYERAMCSALYLERLKPGETLLIVSDSDPNALLGELRPMLEKGFTYHSEEAGPETWRILFSCERSVGYRKRSFYET